MAQYIFSIEPARTFDVTPVIHGETIGSIRDRRVEIVRFGSVVPLNEIMLV